MFKFIGEGFTSSKFYNSDSFKADDGQVISYINTSIATKYKNPHTGVETWDNMRVTLKGDIADAFEREAGKGCLVHVEGIIHERKWTDKKSGNVRYYSEVTVQSFRPLVKAKKLAPAESVASESPLAKLTKEQIGALPADVLKSLIGA